VTFSVVVIFGYVRHAATVSLSVQVVFRRGATRRPDTSEHEPDSVHVFFPLEGVVRSHDKTLREPFFTVDFLTVNPGRTDTVVGEDTRPVFECTSTVNV
jgi:hypothetical protein